jgi:hypothetical protein
MKEVNPTMATQTTPTNVVDRAAFLAASKQAAEARQLAAAREDLAPVVAKAKQILEEIAADADTAATFAKLRSFSWDEVRRVSRNAAPAAAEYASVIERALEQASSTISSARRELAAIPGRVENLTIRDLRPIIHFTADAEKVGIAPFSPAEPGRIRLTVANHTSVAERIRDLCATAEGTLASLLRVCEPAVARGASDTED